MNYRESKTILAEIKKAKRILLNCHRSPDADSVCSSLAMREVLVKLGKEVDVYCPNEVPDRLDFLPHFKKVEEKDFKAINFEKYDLFISLDTSTFDHATNLEEKPDNLKIIVIDHHKSNDKYGDLNLVDDSASATCEILYVLFKNWRIDFNDDINYLLLTGIIEDSGAFRYPGTSSRTLKIASRLFDKGVNKDEIIRQIFFTIDIKQFKFWGIVFDSLKTDKKHRFVWATIKYDDYKEFQSDKSLRQSTATAFFQSFKDTDFAILLVEQSKEKVNIGFRSRTGLDVSKIAVEFGGGGHQYAAGAGTEGISLEEVEKKVLKVARKYAKKSKK